MNGSNYRWVIVAAGGLLGCVAIGCSSTGSENMPPIATQPSKPPSATITQR